MENNKLLITITIIILLLCLLYLQHTYYSTATAELELQKAFLRGNINTLESVDIEYVLEADQPPDYQRIGFPMHHEDFLRLTSFFGKRGAIIGGGYSDHSGLDMSGVFAARIVAVKSGYVADHWYNDPIKGWAIRVDHGDGTEAEYFHLSDSYVHERRPDGSRWYVEAGETIGRQGNTGLSENAHLHFTYRVDGVEVNPLRYFREVVQ